MERGTCVTKLFSVQVRNYLLLCVVLVKNVQNATVPGHSSTSHDQQQLRGIDRGPDNTVAVSGSTAILNCVAFDAPQMRIMWAEFITNRQVETIISDGEQITIGNPNKDRYRILHGFANEYNLAISDVRLGDGGTYKCRDTVDDNRHTACADLVILENHPNCISSLEQTNGLVILGSRHYVLCDVHYAGPYDPDMEWTGIDDEFELQEGTTVDGGKRRTYSQLMFTVTSAMQGRALELHTAFTRRHQQPPSGCSSYMAASVPGYHHQNHLPTLRVENI